MSHASRAGTSGAAPRRSATDVEMQFARAGARRRAGSAAASRPEVPSARCARVRRDRGVQAALAVGGDMRPEATSSRARYEANGARGRCRCSSTSAFARLARRPARGARRDRRCRCSRRASSRPREHLRERARGGRRRGAPDPPRPRRRDLRARCMRDAEALGLDTLVEAHDADELERATALGAPVIGVNARDLSHLRDRPRARSSSCVARAPRDRVVIAESGDRTRAPRAPPPSSPARRDARRLDADARRRPRREARASCSRGRSSRSAG